MMERRSWTTEEDRVLATLYQKLKLNKWSLIARTMAEQYNLPGRTGKQCRERYTNHLDPMLVKDSWSYQEEKLLYRLHDEMGNKWAIIAQRLGGRYQNHYERTDNCVKNHFYSKLRKAMRRLNRLIHERYRKQLRELKLNVLYKIIEASEDKFKPNPTYDNELSQFCCKLKNRILQFSFDGEHEVNLEDENIVAELVEEIGNFNKNYKRKPKILRRASALGIDANIAIPLTVRRSKTASSNEESEGSDLLNSDLNCLESSEDDIIHPEDKKQDPKIECQINLKSSNRSNRRKQKEVVFQKRQEIQIQVHNQGMLEDSNKMLPFPPFLQKQVSQEPFCLFDHKSDDYYFFDESEMRLPNPMGSLFKKQSEDDQFFH